MWTVTAAASTRFWKARSCNTRAYRAEQSRNSSYYEASGKGGLSRWSAYTLKMLNAKLCDSTLRRSLTARSTRRLCAVWKACFLTTRKEETECLTRLGINVGLNHFLYPECSDLFGVLGIGKVFTTG